MQNSRSLFLTGLSTTYFYVILQRERGKVLIGREEGGGGEVGEGSRKGARYPIPAPIAARS